MWEEAENQSSHRAQMGGIEKNYQMKGPSHNQIRNVASRHRIQDMRPAANRDVASSSFHSLHTRIQDMRPAAHRDATTASSSFHSSRDCSQGDGPAEQRDESFVGYSFSGYRLRQITSGKLNAVSFQNELNKTRNTYTYATVSMNPIIISTIQLFLSTHLERGACWEDSDNGEYTIINRDMQQIY